MIAEKVSEHAEEHVTLDLYGRSPVEDYVPSRIVLTYTREDRGTAYTLRRAQVTARTSLPAWKPMALDIRSGFPTWIEELADTHMPGGRRVVRPLWRVKALS